ncbi:MAG TPA: glycosyltransferase family 1 protein [Gemmatimonadales bacterium]
MKLALNGRFLAQRTTGVQRHARELVRALDRRLDQDDRIEATLYAPPDATLDLALRRIRVRRVGWTRGHAWEQLELPLHARGQLLLNLGNTGPVLMRRQFVTIHDASVFAVPESYSTSFSRYYRLLLPFLGKRALRVLTVSEFSRNELVRWMGIAREKIRVTPGGHEHILAPSADRHVLSRHGLGSRPYVLAVGSLSRHKNLDAAAAAMRLLGRHEWDYVLAGPVNQRIFGSAASGPSDLVVHLGYVSEAELRALYEQASCFVYPSRYEGFGLPPLEAMACGCPVVVSRAASLPEVCGDAALYADADEPQQLAAAIRRVMCEEGVAQGLRQKGRERAREWSWNASADKTLAAVREVMGP